MASMFRIGSTRRKAEAPGKIRIQFKGKAPEASNDDSDVVDENEDDDDLPITFGNKVPDDLPEDTIIVQPEAVEDSTAKKKRDVPLRIDTSVLDNVNCTACGRQLNPYKSGALQKHPELKVVICKHCERFLSSGEISKDKDGADEQCRWCGEGGRLLVCDDCSSAFCKSCVMRNFSRSEFNNITFRAIKVHCCKYHNTIHLCSRIYSQDHWQCYLCNKASVQILRENYRKIRDTLKALHEKEKERKACPTNIGTQPSGRSVGSRQSSKGISSNSSAKSGEMNNCSDSAPFTLIAFEDLNVQSENVDATIDKLFTSTNTLTEVLKALRSQSQFSTQQKRQQHARALNKSLETYMKSIKTILKESRHITKDEEHLTASQDKNPAKIKTKEPTSSLSSKLNSSSRLSANSGTVPRGTSGTLSTSENCTNSRKPLHRSSSASNKTADDESEVPEKIKADLTKGGTAKKAECVKSVNGDLSDNEDFVTSNSKSSKNSKDSEPNRNTLQVSLDRCTVSVAALADVTKTAKENVKSSKKDFGVNSKDKTKESVSDRNNKDINDREVIQDSEKSERPESASLKDKSDSEVETSDHDSPKNKSLSKKNVKKLSGKKARSDSVSDKSHEEDEVEEDNDLHKSPSDAEHGLSADAIEKDQAEIPPSKTSGTCNDENLAAKLDLMKELADEVLRNGSDNDGEEDEDDLPITFGEDNKTSSESSLKKVVPKRKKSQVSSDEDTTTAEKKSKVSNSTDARKSPKKPAAENSTKAKTNKKQKQVSTDVVAASGDSSSDLLLSDDDGDAHLSTRRQKRKKKNDDTTKSKTAAVTTKKDSEGKINSPTKSLSTEVEDIDKEIEKLSKLPTMRKRKAADLNEDEEVTEETESVVPQESQKTQKKSKPGPKCSKKGIEYEDLSSDENEEKDDEEDIEDEEDEPSVSFFDNTADVADQKMDKDIDENEIAKNGLLEDMDSDNDNTDDIEDNSSTEEDSDAAEKTKKKEPKKTADIKKEDKIDEKEDDSDENIGKRKKIHSKLLDAKLSDSDSDVGKSKKKKKDDEESFKASSSSNSDSSSESDLSEDDDDDSDDTEDEDEPNSKKKGKKKSNKKKRKGKGKKKSDDDEDDGDSEEGKKNKKGKEKKRKRIKKMSNSSDEGDNESGGGDDEEEEDDDDPNNSKAGKRKQIRKVMSKNKLEDSTKAAAKAEEKRRKRIAAKQREFNIETITDENNPMTCPVTTKLILEAGKEEGDEPVIQVNKKLIRKLKPHQVEAVQFMWDCLYESVKRSKKSEGAGCLLAHCMGLGKTLSVVAFVHTILTHEKVLKHRTCLIVSPLNTILNWKNEWDMWLDEKDKLEKMLISGGQPPKSKKVWELTGCKQNDLRASTLKDWQESGGIMIIGYEMYRNLTTGNRCKNKRQKKIFQETLVDPGPDLVICDEGHILKNEASAISKAMNQMKTLRRVVLTGTPLQNNLTEYHCMVSFVKPNLLGTRKEFTNRFISPIQNGQCTDSTQRDYKLMKARAHVLHEMLAGCVQRRDYSALTKFLPPKQEYVISVRLTNIQIELYEKYLEVTGQGVDGVFSNKGARLFRDYQNLMKIWTHPWVLKLAEIRDELKMKYDDEESFIDDDDTEDEKSFSSSSSSEDDQVVSDSAGEGTSAKASTKKGTRRTRAAARKEAEEDSDPEVIADWKTKRTANKDGDMDLVQPEESDKSVTSEWWAPYVTEDDKSKFELSNKLYLLFEILRMCEEIGDKVLIFSQSILSLNIIENFLEIIDTKFQQECDNLTEEEREQKGVFGKSWTKNLDYYRMDGSTSAQNRQLWAANFNDIENYRTRLFLISTRAGGLGINLVAANRVIIFDASWNPSHDVQSIFRVYRFGQTKPCYIYRFLAQGTMEEKIYERQVTKLSLSQRVVDEHQIERHFSANDLKELYNFRPDRLDDGTEKPTLSLPKDPLLAEILTANKHCVVSFHEHDSLLENKIEQTLTEEEKKAAWEEYENEKKGIIIRGSGLDKTAWPMMAAAQFLSREQITNIVTALRQQLPDITEDVFHLHLQQALKRQVQIKQEEMRRMELLRLQELNFLNMMQQQNQQIGLSRGQVNQNMAWLQKQQQQLRAMQQNSMMMGASANLLGALPSSSSMNRLGQTSNKPISNKPEEAIDLDDN